MKHYYDEKKNYDDETLETKIQKRYKSKKMKK